LASSFCLSKDLLGPWSHMRAIGVIRLAALLRGALFHPSGQALPVSGPGRVHVVGMVLTEPEQESKTRTSSNRLSIEIRG
jgi:hypothetical protein